MNNCSINLLICLTINTPAINQRKRNTQQKYKQIISAPDIWSEEDKTALGVCHSSLITVAPSDTTILS